MVRSQRLKSHVILAYTDISAAGVRTLLSVDTEDFVTDNSLQVEELKDSRAACVSSNPENDITSQKIVILNHRMDDLSLIIVNVKLNKDVANFVADCIMEQLAKSEVKKVTILAAEHTISIIGELKTIELVNGGSLCDSKISDPFLNVMLQFLMIEPLPTTVMLLDGNVVKEGTRPNQDDDSARCIQIFQERLTKEFELKFDIEYSKSLEYRGYDSDNINISENMYV